MARTFRAPTAAEDAAHARRTALRERAAECLDFATTGSRGFPARTVRVKGYLAREGRVCVYHTEPTPAMRELFFRTALRLTALAEAV